LQLAGAQPKEEIHLCGGGLEPAAEAQFVRRHAYVPPFPGVIMPSQTSTIRIDNDRFDKWQRALGRTLTEQIRDALKAVPLEPAQKKDVTADIGFRVAAILDGSGGVFKDDDEAQVVVMFAEVTSPEALVACEGESWMHEYAQGWVEDMPLSDFEG
jgi:hypothetical protein